LCDLRVRHAGEMPDTTQGDALLDSVYRFIGQAAPSIIFTEIDFEVLDDKAVRKLFVGATRCIIKLVMA
jgi:hypothetical protein